MRSFIVDDGIPLKDACLVSKSKSENQGSMLTASELMRIRLSIPENVAGSLEFLEWHLGPLREDEDIPVCIPHLCCDLGGLLTVTIIPAVKLMGENLKKG